MDNIIAFVTCASRKEANKIARSLVTDKLAACVNILGGVESVYRWQGKIDTSREVLLVIKSKKSKLTKLIGLVKARHSYQVPEIIALPIIAGEEKYLRWINESLR